MQCTPMRLLITRHKDEDRLNAHIVNDEPDAVAKLMETLPSDQGRPYHEFLQEVMLTAEQQEALKFLRRLDHAEREPVGVSRWLRFAQDLFDDALERQHPERIHVAAMRKPEDREALVHILCDAEMVVRKEDCKRARCLREITTALGKISPVPADAIR